MRVDLVCVPSSAFLILSIFSSRGGSYSQTAFDSFNSTLSTSALTTYLATATDEGSAVCTTGAGDWYMDPPTAVRLGALFCQDLEQEQNFPAEGTEFFTYHYPTELSQETPGSAKLTEIELSGLIGEMSLFRDEPVILNGTLYVHGTDEQCARDNCTDVMVRAVDACKYNSHYVGGVDMFVTDCGIYSINIANCSGNWFDPSCVKWHVLHPAAGESRNDSLAPIQSALGPNRTLDLPPPQTVTATVTTTVAGSLSMVTFTTTVDSENGL